MGVKRSSEITVQVVHRFGRAIPSEWHIAVSVDHSPYKSLGPYTEKITVPEALQLVAVDMKLDHLFTDEGE